MSEEAAKDDLTPAQRQAVEKAWDILTEHFEHVLLVVDTEIIGEEGTRQDAQQGFWHGGSMAALGAAVFAKDRILRSGKHTADP